MKRLFKFAFIFSGASAIVILLTLFIYVKWHGATLQFSKQVFKNAIMNKMPYQTETGVGNLRFIGIRSLSLNENGRFKIVLHLQTKILNIGNELLLIGGILGINHLILFDFDGTVRGKLRYYNKTKVLATIETKMTDIHLNYFRPRLKNKNISLELVALQHFVRRSPGRPRHWHFNKKFKRVALKQINFLIVQRDLYYARIISVPSHWYTSPFKTMVKSMTFHNQAIQIHLH